VLAWLEPPLFVPGGGAEWLADRGVVVVEIPALAAEARAVNAHLLPGWTGAHRRRGPGSGSGEPSALESSALESAALESAALESAEQSAGAAVGSRSGGPAGRRVNQRQGPRPPHELDQARDGQGHPEGQQQADPGLVSEGRAAQPADEERVAGPDDRPRRPSR